MARTWKCRKCGKQNPRRKGNCANKACAGKRPKPRRPEHRKILEVPYEQWSTKYGDNCNICGRAPSPTKRHDRDHDHKSGKDRGILCTVCNRRLSNRITIEWLLSAAKYLQRAEDDTEGLVGA